MAFDLLEDRVTPVIGAFEIPPVVPAGLGYDGVVRWNENGGPSGFCTGSLMNTGRHILTAAHCVTDDAGNQDVTDVQVFFDLVNNQTIQVGATVTWVHPNWDGETERGWDIAILTLDEVAPIEADRYPIWRGDNPDPDSLAIVVGYGSTGTGDLGQVENSLGVKRGVYNLANVVAATGAGNAGPNALLQLEFDNPWPAIGPPTGLGFSLGIAGQGDSGGPLFINNRVAGIVSYGDFSFGGTDQYTNVRLYADDVDAQLEADSVITLDMNSQAMGNDGVADTVIVRVVGANAEIFVNGRLATTVALDDATSFTLIGSADDDTFLIDGDLGDDVTVDGGLGRDSLEIIGDGLDSATYTPNGFGAGTIVIGDDTISFSGLEPIIVSGLASYTLDLTLAANVKIENVSPSRTRVSGTEGGVEFESVTFFDVDSFTIDGSADADTFVALTPLSASGLQNFTILGEGGNDILEIGTDFRLPVAGGAFTFNGGPAGDDLLVVEGNADLVLTNTSLSSVSSLSGVSLGVLSVTGINRAQLTGGSNGNLLDAATFTGGPVTLMGEAGNDTLVGTPGSDEIYGGSDSDVITGGLGDDVISGDGGQDFINPGLGFNLVDGGEGQDWLQLLDFPLNSFNARAAGSDLLIEFGNFEGVRAANIDTAYVQFAEGNPAAVTATLEDLSTTGVDAFLIDLPGNDVKDVVTIEGRNVADNIGLAIETIAPSLIPLTTVTLAWGKVSLALGETTDGDTVVVDGLNGDDVIKADFAVTNGPSASTFLVSLVGGQGDDYLSADATLIGGDGDDTLVGSPGDDSLDGGAGNDTLYGSEGSNTLIGGPGDDLFYLTEGTNVVDGGTGFDEILVEGTDGNDTIAVSQILSDVTIVVNGVDSVNNTTGIERILVEGFAGSDTITLANLAIPTLADAGLGSDAINATGSTASMTLIGGDGDDSITGGTGGDSIEGGAGADSILGLGGADSIYGGDQNDSIVGGTGNDFLYGGTGSDVITWNNGDGSDLVEGGEGDDQAVVNGAPAAGNDFTVLPNGVRVRFDRTNLGLFTLDIGTTERLSITGSTAGDNVVIGNLRDTDMRLVNVDLGVDAVRDTVTINDGNLGSDIGITTPSAGSGIIDVEQSNNAHVLITNSTAACPVGPADDLLTINAGQGNDTVQASLGTEEEIGFVVNAGDGNDFVSANGTLNGGVGDDTLQGAGGDCPVTIDGGAGNDQICGNDGADLLLGGTGRDSIFGLAGDDTIDGGADRDWLAGNTGNDSITGGTGNDTILGGAGSDSLFGQEDFDVLLGDADAECGVDQAFILVTGQGNDTLDGGAGNDTLNGDEGNDSLLGGEGADLLGPVVFQGVAFADAGNDTMNGGAGNDTIDGDTGNDSLLGEAGNDSILGGEGNDSIFGGADNDVIDGEAGADSILGDAGDDTIQGGAGSDTIDGGIGNDVVDGGADNDAIVGNEGDDTLLGSEGGDFIVGNAGNDFIDGGAGPDSIQGNAGNDSILGGAGSDTITGDDGNDFINAGDDFDTVFGNAGNDTVLGGTGNDSIQGNTGDDSISGGAGDDLVYGGLGADRLDGDAGRDRLCGGLAPGESGDASADGNDTINGGDDDDAMVGDAGDDVLSGDAGNDQIWGSTGNDQLFGGVGDDSMVGGAGNDVLQGGDGNDLMFGVTGNDTLWGGLGDDMIYGGDGDDVMLGGTPETANTAHTVRDPSLPNDGNDTMLGGNGFDRVDGGNGDNLLDAGDDGIRETVLAGLGNDIGYSHLAGGRRQADTMALDGGHNQDFHRGVLVEPPIPVEECNFVTFVVPDSSRTGQKELHDGSIVAHPPIRVRPLRPVKVRVKAPVRKPATPAKARKAAPFAARKVLVKKVTVKAPAPKRD